MHRRVLFLVLGVFVFGCSKDVNPTYLKAHQERADGICACVKAQAKLPTKTVDGAETYDVEPAQKIVKATSECIAKFPDQTAIKTPTGDPSGIYEESLSDAGRRALEAVNKLASDCRDIHLKQWREVF